MGKGKVRVFLLRRRAVAALGALVLAGAIFYVVSCPPSITASSAQRQLPIYCVEREQKMCSVSFDAAWGNEDTQILIDILARYNVKATFFCVGDWAEKYPESVKALHDAGHEVMSHSNHHDHYNSLTAEEIVADVTASNQRIAASTGAGGGGTGGAGAGRGHILRRPCDLRHPLHGHGAYPVERGQSGLEGL